MADVLALWRRLVLTCLLAQSAWACSAHADDNSIVKGPYTLLNPTPDKDLRDYNPDRPSKITSPFTIDAGHVDIESDLVNYLRSDMKGITDRALQYLDPTIKLGVLSNLDVEMTLNGDEYVRQSKDTNPRLTRSLNGFGDVFFRAKVNLIGDDGGDVALAFVPYVKLPANDAASLALGDGSVESGGILTSLIKLPHDFTLGLQTEVDALQGGNDTRLHPNFVNIATISHEVPGIKNLTASGEIYSSVSKDLYTPSVYTADFAIAYLIKPSTQLDVGANIGINKEAPGLQLYAGIAQRF
jgi:Putative MetA-pathway of phenol degradation